jgi:predicted amidohydrolase YtcJ
MGKTGRIFGPGERLSMEEAVIGYTRNGAFLTFEENLKGTLEAGMLADFVILSQDIFTVPAEAIRKTAVEQTYIGGKLVYDASKSEL